MDPKFKLVTSNSVEHFERRLTELIEGLDRDDVVVDIKFATASYGESVEFSALVHYETPDARHD